MPKATSTTENKRKVVPLRKRRAAEVEIYEPPQPVQIYEGMRIDGSPIALPVLIPMLGLFYGAAFQIGYFINVGIEFMPFMSALDFVFSAAAMLTLTILWLPVGQFLFRRVRTQIDKGTFDGSFIAFITVGYMKFELLIFAAVLLVFALADVDLGEFMRWTCLFVLFVAASIMFLKLKEEAYLSGRFVARTCMWFAVHSGMLALGLGVAYAHYFAGKRCDVVAIDRIYVDAKYLRPVGEGHLIRSEGQTLFLSKTQVKEVACGKRVMPALPKASPIGTDWPLP
jgi:hypothetical protein